MARSILLLAVSLVLFNGCMPESSPKEKYDAAVRDLERAQSKLDNLRPAYDVARQTAANAVCKEIAGTTPEESASAALAGLSDTLNNPAALTPLDDAAKKDEAKKSNTRNGDELDKTIDNLVAGEKKFQETQASLAAPVAKAHEVMQKIKTPGTPEAKQYEAKLAAMEEVKSYERQKSRVEKAQQEVDDAEAEIKK